MFFKKSKVVGCVVCGNAIDPKARRFVEKNRVTKVERHTHIDCRKPDAGAGRLPPDGRR